MSNTTRVITGYRGPFNHKQFLVHHSGGRVRTLDFRIGKHCGHYAGEFNPSVAGTPLIKWVPTP